MGQHPDTLDPPAWWLEQLVDLMAPRGRQRAVLRAIESAFSVSYDPSKLNTMLKGKSGCDIMMALHLSLVLGIPPPAYIAKTEAGAKRLLGEALLANEIDPQMVKIAAGVRKTLMLDQGVPVQPEHGPRPRGDGPQRKR